MSTRYPWAPCRSSLRICRMLHTRNLPGCSAPVPAAPCAASACIAACVPSAGCVAPWSLHSSCTVRPLCLNVTVFCCMSSMAFFAVSHGLPSTRSIPSANGKVCKVMASQYAPAHSLPCSNPWLLTRCPLAVVAVQLVVLTGRSPLLQHHLLLTAL